MAKKKVSAKKTPLAKQAKQASTRKAQPKKKAKTVTSIKVKGTAKKPPQEARTAKTVTAAKAPEKRSVKKKGTPTKEATKPAAPLDLRQRVSKLLNKLPDSALQWLHFEMTDPDAEAEITSDEQQQEAIENFPPFNRPALILELTSIAVDDLKLANSSDLAETLEDEDSLRVFLTFNKDY